MFIWSTGKIQLQSTESVSVSLLRCFWRHFISDAFTVTFTMRLPSEGVMSEKEREPRCEYWGIPSFNGRLGRGRRKIRDRCLSKAQGTRCFWETAQPAVSKSTESSRKVRIAKYGFHTMRVKIDLGKNGLYDYRLQSTPKFNLKATMLSAILSSYLCA